MIYKEKLTNERKIGLLLTVIFIISRVYFYCIGVQFDAARLDSLNQFVEPNQLKNNLFESLYYLHMQPPGFNLFIGVVLKLFPEHYYYVFSLIYFIAGVVLTNVMYYFMINMGINSKLSAIITALFVLSPSCILYEHWLFYTYPTMVLLCLSIMMLHKFVESPNYCNGLLFFAFIMMISLTRSLFHLVWFLSIMVLLLLFIKQKRVVLISSALPLLVILLLYAKNYYYFDHFGLSSTLGMHLSKVVQVDKESEPFSRLIQKDQIHGIIHHKPFLHLHHYENHLSASDPLSQFTNIPILSKRIKSSGAPNMNNYQYIAISDKYFHDVWVVLKHNLLMLFEHTYRAFHRFFVPSSYYEYIHENRMIIYPYERLYSIFIKGNFMVGDPILTKNPTNISALLHMGVFDVILFCALLVYFMRYLYSARSDRFINISNDITIMYMVFNMVYITGVSVGMEFGENNRYHFLIEPLLWIMLGYYLHERKIGSELK